MSLIAGMPEVIAYIKSQDERIKKLKEENEKLKEEFDGWKASYDDDIREARAEGIDELKEENEKLKKANKKYHMECLKLNRELGDWHKALNEDVAGLEHLQSEINLHFWKRCHGPWDADIEKIKR